MWRCQSRFASFFSVKLAKLKTIVYTVAPPCIDHLDRSANSLYTFYMELIGFMLVYILITQDIHMLTLFIFSFRKGGNLIQSILLSNPGHCLLPK